MNRVRHVPLGPMRGDSIHSFDYDDSDDDDGTVDSRSVCSRKSFSTLKTSSQVLFVKRFAQATGEERSFSAQLNSLADKERFCVEVLRIHWETDNPPLPGLMYLRFARFYKFNPKAARKALDHFDQRYLTMTAAKLEPILQTKTLFPVPGLKSKDGLAMFYMRPSRYFPKQAKTKYIVDNLAYVMSSMVEKEETSISGIGLLACMDDWAMDNFSVDYCRQFMTMLQGGVPARVGLFLLVNPPTWFKKVWKIMKPMFAPSFRKNVKIIFEVELQEYLAPDYRKFLPDDMMTGEADTKQIVENFIADRHKIEESLFGDDF